MVVLLTSICQRREHSTLNIVKTVSNCKKKNHKLRGNSNRKVPNQMEKKTKVKAYQMNG